VSPDRQSVPWQQGSRSAPHLAPTGASRKDWSLASIGAVGDGPAQPASVIASNKLTTERARLLIDDTTATASDSANRTLLVCKRCATSRHSVQDCEISSTGAAMCVQRFQGTAVRA